jgi:signal transduction histidine kinase
MRLVLTTTAAAVLVAGIAMLIRDYTIIRRTWAAEVSTEASVLVLALGPALDFDDQRVAQQYLDALQARRPIRVAALYDAAGHLFASYRSSVSEALPASSPRPTSVELTGARAELVQPVVRGSETIGYLYLMAQYDITGRIYAYLSIFGLVMCVSLAVAYVFSSRLQRGIMEPLQSIGATARKLVDERDYSLRVQATTSEEFRIVVDALNNMLQEVQAAARLQEEANRSLREEVAIRKAAEDALALSDRRKDDFLATLAHELRNPLAPIRQGIRLLERSDVGAERSQWAREMIERQVKRMALMLDDLLEVSRITRGRLELKKEAVELSALIKAAVETSMPLIDSKRQRLAIDVPAHPVHLLVDALRMSQSISNLLTNASKYTDPEGRIALRVHVSAEALCISVTDSGIGLDPQVIPSLFQMFSQVDPAIDRAEGGLGIGLALVKGFVELHGGEVEARSEGLGKGSEFTIRLPPAAVISQAAPAAMHEPSNEPQAAGHKVLVADDNKDAADSMAMLLEFAGFEMLVAHEGREALRKIMTEKPAAAILDIGMADMTGYEIARRVRSSGDARTYLIAVTGWGQAEDVARAKEAGFDEHLTKPVDPARIEALLRERLSR